MPGTHLPLRLLCSDSTAACHPLQLPARDHSVPRARHTVDDWLDRQEVPGEVREQAVLVLSELATNAVRHTDSAHFLCGAGITAHGAVQIEVHDEDTTLRLPRRRTVTPDRESGRGLHIVAALAQAWGVTPSPATGGSAVWARLLPPSPFRPASPER